MNRNTDDLNRDILNDEEFAKQLKTLKNLNSKSDNAFLIKSIIIFLICLISTIGIMRLYTSYLMPNNIALKFGTIKISNDTYEEVYEKFEDEDDTITHIIDILILSEQANIEGLGEINKDITFAEREELSQKLIDKYKNESENVTDQDVINYYENNKYNYIEGGTIDCYAFKLKDVIPDDFSLNKSSLEKNTLDYSSFYSSGIPYPVEGEIYFLGSVDNEYYYTSVEKTNLTYKDINNANIFEMVKEDLQFELYQGRILEITDTMKQLETVEIYID